MAEKQTTTTTGDDDDELAKLRSDPKYGKLKKLMRAEVSDFVAEQRAARKASKTNAKTDDDDDGNFFDRLFSGDD